MNNQPIALLFSPPLDHHHQPLGVTSQAYSAPENGDEAPIWQCILAGGFGGLVGDSAMHSLDTIKTRQQGSSVAKYSNMLGASKTILAEEGVRGLYSGYTAAMLGSFPSAAIFFGTYELTKRTMIDEWQLNDTFAHLTGGFLGDLASSIVYVPSEVLKTRLQLQGRYNNPHYNSGYNYVNLRHAIKSIIAEEGVGALFHGYKATLSRDLPFSALQFAFYEKFRAWMGEDLNIRDEIITGAAAGGLAGIITTPMDVVKTRVQTTTQQDQRGSSLTRALVTVYRTEGAVGLFSGVGPRFIWTSVQSSIMLLLYQLALKQLGGGNSEPPLMG